MDLFVDAIDAKLQPRERYRKLLKSRKKQKISHKSEESEGNGAGGASDLGPEGPGEGRKGAEDGPPPTAVDADERGPSGDEKVLPFLNALVDACTDVVRAANAVAWDKYRNGPEAEAGRERVEAIRARCRQAAESIESMVRRMAPEHVFDGTTDHLDVLFDEVDQGFKKHNRTRYPRDAASLDESLGSDESASESAGAEEGAEGPGVPKLGAAAFKSKTSFKKGLLKLDKVPLNSYSIDVDASRYSLGARPQDRWKKCIDNFGPGLRRTGAPVKFNRIEPQISFEKGARRPRFFEKKFVPKIYPKPEILAYAGREELANPHLYAQEINSLVWSEERLESTHQGYAILGGEGDLFRATPDRPVTELRYRMVRTPAEFDAMLERVAASPMLSIDVEHYDSDTYRGFICLLQLSTPEEDYIVDPFGMFTHLGALNRVTTDPRILKVMHGSGNDVIWLQRDFGVYIVNLFDTREAAKALGLSEQSLTKLLEKYFGIALNKTYQLADWSVRPLNEDMLNYACADSHHLIPLYVKLKNEILARPDGRVKLLQVMNSSRAICLKQYTDKGIELFQKFKSIKRRHKIQAHTLDFVAYNFLLNLIAFRNYAARELDRSEHQIVRDYQISIIVKRMVSAPPDARRAPPPTASSWPASGTTCSPSGTRSRTS